MGGSVVVQPGIGKGIYGNSASPPIYLQSHEAEAASHGRHLASRTLFISLDEPSVYDGCAVHEESMHHSAGSYHELQYKHTVRRLHFVGFSF